MLYLPVHNNIQYYILMSNLVARARVVMTDQPFLNQIGRTDGEKINKNYDRNRLGHII